MREELPERVHLRREKRCQRDIHGEREPRGRRKSVHWHVAQVEQGCTEEFPKGPPVLVHLGGEPIQLCCYSGIGQVDLRKCRLTRQENLARTIKVAGLEAQLPKVRAEKQAGAASSWPGQAGLQGLRLALQEGLRLGVGTHACRGRDRHVGQPQRAHLRPRPGEDGKVRPPLSTGRQRARASHHGKRSRAARWVLRGGRGRAGEGGRGGGGGGGKMQRPR